MISIITPVYNGARYIESCLQCVIAQQLAELEHIVVDGGSVDGTTGILRRYAVQYPHIRWISEADRGQSDAMNKGLALARGEVVGFLNSDDYYAPAVLGRIAAIFKHLPVPSLLVGNCNVWDDAAALVEVNRPRYLKFTQLLLGPGLYPFPFNSSAYFYHAVLHQLVGGYDVDDHYAMDLDFLLRAVQVAHVTYMNETWGNYRRVTGTKTVQNLERGESKQAIRRVITRHRQPLPAMKRWPLAAAYRFSSTDLATSVIYFARHPGELFWRAQARAARLMRRVT